MYTLEHLKRNDNLLIYLNSEEEFDKLKTALKGDFLETYQGRHCYSVFKNNYSSSSSSTSVGSYDDNSIILHFNDIEDLFELPENWIVEGSNSKNKTLLHTNLNLYKLIVNKFPNSEVDLKFLSDNYYSSYEKSLVGKLKTKDYKEITLQQFRKFVLEDDTPFQGRKIIGYKLINPKYNDVVLKITGANLNWKGFLEDGFTIKGDLQRHTYITYVKILKQTGLLNLWFKPIFINNFQEGDYFTVINNHPKYQGEAGKVYRITDINGNYLGIGDNYYINIDFVQVRKSTSKEIADFKKINALPEINGYDGKIVKIDDNLYVNYGCAKIPYLLIKHLHDAINCNKKVAFETRALTEVTLDSGVVLTVKDINKIYTAFEAFK